LKLKLANQALGPAFTIGHSYLTTSQSIKDDQADNWFTNIVKTEIIPLLKEYWFDEPNQVEKAKKILLP